VVTVALLALAAAPLRKPCGVDQTCARRSDTAAGVATVFSPATFQACVPLTT
jgi:hypothetical protein